MKCFECGEEVDGSFFIMPIPAHLGGKKALYFCEDDFIFVKRGPNNLTSYDQSQRIKKALVLRKKKGIVLGRPKVKLIQVEQAAKYRLMGYSWAELAKMFGHTSRSGTLRRRVIEYLNFDFFSQGNEIKKDIETRQQLKGEIRCQQSEPPAS